jgi:hypothetical protein
MPFWWPQANFSHVNRYRSCRKLVPPERLNALHIACVAQGNSIVMRQVEIVSLRFLMLSPSSQNCRPRYGRWNQNHQAHKIYQPINQPPGNEDNSMDNGSSSSRRQYKESPNRRLLRDIGRLYWPQINTQSLLTTCLS